MNSFCFHTGLAAAVVLCLGCSATQKAIVPSNNRNWIPEQAVLPTAEIVGDTVAVRNVRNCQWFSEDFYVPEFEDRTYKLSELESVDFFIVPFEATPAIAHTMLSFEFRPPDRPPGHLTVSVEIRREEGEEYAAWKGGLRQYELMYVLADERDAVGLRAKAWQNDVYLYPTTATPEVARQLLVDVLGRVNELASRPEFYDTVTNNCTTNIARHINRVKPNRIAYDYRVLLPGLSDKLAYDEGLLKPYGTFEETKQRAYITGKAIAAADSDRFSELIRR
ncbi:MAG: DUF4105 domain-containing protein [Planctomycetota bacterium]